MSANIKVIFIVIIGVSACLLSIFSSQHFHNKDQNSHLALSHIDKVGMRIEYIRVLGRSFIQDANHSIWGQISQTMTSLTQSLQTFSNIEGRWWQEIEVLNQHLENYHAILTQLYEPAVNLKTQKKALQQIGFEFSHEVEKEIIDPFRKEEGLQIYNGKSIDPFKSRAKDAAYDLVALHIKQQLILLELLLSSDLDGYKQKKQNLSTALAQHEARLRYMAVLMGSEPNLKPVLASLHQKLSTLIEHESAIIELFTSLAELDDRLRAAGEKLLAAGGRLSSKIASDTLQTRRLNRIVNWGLLLGILGGLSILGTLIARNIIQFVEDLNTAKQVLGKSEEKYRSFIEKAPVAMYTLNTNGEFTYANRKLLQLTGYQIEDWQNKPFYPMVHPEDLDIVTQNVQKRLEGAGKAEPNEIRIFHVSGEIMWVRIYSQSIYAADERKQKKLIGIQSFLEDITERKMAEEALRESEERYRMLFNSANDAVFVHQPGTNGRPGNFIEANEIACQRYGYTREELLAMSPPDLAVPRRRKEAHGRVKRILSERHRIFEIIHQAKDGTEIPVEVSAQLFELNGTPTILSIVRDITDRIRAEKERVTLEAQLRQAQKMESIGTLAGGIAHDFNNILSPVIGYTELLLEDIPQESSLRISLNHVLKGALRAKDLVKQILTFSRQTTQEIKPLRVQNILEEVLKLSRSTLPSTIEIKQDIKDACGMILADPTQIHQIVMNLITNAFHAMEDSGGTLTVRLNETNLVHGKLLDLNMSPGPYVCLTIADTGSGMDEKTQERLFEPYFTTKERDKGTGLGLAVVHGIVSSYGGAVMVESEPEKGTVFQVYLPRVVSVETKTEIQSIAALSGDERILLVDDEVPVSAMIKAMLERLGYRVTVRNSSIETLATFRTAPNRFDLVITDMTMPDLTGDKLAMEIKKIRSNMPVVLCTGFSEKVSQDKASELNIDGVLMKPISMVELAKALRRVLD